MPMLASCLCWLLIVASCARCQASPFRECCGLDPRCPRCDSRIEACLSLARWRWRCHSGVWERSEGDGE